MVLKSLSATTRCKHVLQIVFNILYYNYCETCEGFLRCLDVGVSLFANQAGVCDILR